MRIQQSCQVFFVRQRTNKQACLMETNIAHIVHFVQIHKGFCIPRRFIIILFEFEDLSKISNSLHYDQCFMTYKTYIRLYV